MDERGSPIYRPGQRRPRAPNGAILLCPPMRCRDPACETRHRRHPTSRGSGRQRRAGRSSRRRAAPGSRPDGTTPLTVEALSGWPPSKRTRTHPPRRDRRSCGTPSRRAHRSPPPRSLAAARQSRIRLIRARRRHARALGRPDPSCAVSSSLRQVRRVTVHPCALIPVSTDGETGVCAAPLSGHFVRDDVRPSTPCPE